MLATNNSVAFFSMAGKKLVECSEEPVALRAFSSSEEVYANLTEIINDELNHPLYWSLPSKYKSTGYL